MGNPQQILSEDDHDQTQQPQEAGRKGKAAESKPKKKRKKKQKKRKQEQQPKPDQVVHHGAPTTTKALADPSWKGVKEKATLKNAAVSTSDVNTIGNLHLPEREKAESQQQPQQINKHPIVTTTISGSHPFEVDDSDHCETPLQAYQDLQVILDRLLHQQHQKTPPKSRSSLTIYDPYYCDGGVKTKLASMGFTNVINENRDFYEDIEKGQIPDYDVLVTNPPYSGHHMEKLLEFCASQQSKHKNKPSFLLLPHFVYTKDYYQRALSSTISSSPLPSSPSSFFCFLVPQIRYSYVPPAWVADRHGASKALSKGKETTAPFPSFWYCCHMDGTSVSHTWFEDTFGRSGSIHSKHTSSGLRYARTPVEIPRDFKGEFDPTKKRPNPRARKRMRKVAAAVVGGHIGISKRQQQQQQQRDPKAKKKRRY